MSVLTFRFLILALAVLVCLPAMAQPGFCSQQSFRGAWSLTCSGHTDLSKYRPGIPPGTLVPMAMLGRVVIDDSGNGTGELKMSLAGSLSTLRKQESFTVNPDCTADKSWTLTNTATGLSVSGTAKSVLLPFKGQINSIILAAGDVVLCKHEKITDAVPQ